MAYGKSRYNSYRKRSFNRSAKQCREYAETMNELEEAFDNLDGWYLSSMKDSAYQNYDKYQIRLSNHSADNKYHNLENGFLIVNIKSSKLNFINIIENHLNKIIEKIEKLELSKYRFINVTNPDSDFKITAYYKGFKTKNEVFI